MSKQISLVGPSSQRLATGVGIEEKTNHIPSSSAKPAVKRRRVPCIECDQTFTSKKKMREHWRTVHQQTLTCHYLVRSTTTRLQRNMHTGAFRCPLCGIEEARPFVMKDHAERCNGGGQELELPPFYSTFSVSPTPGTPHFKVISHASTPIPQMLPEFVKPRPLSFFSSAHQRLVHLERHNQDAKADPPTTRVQRAQIRRLFSSGCPVDDIHRYVQCSTLGVHTVLSRHVSSEDYDNLDSDDEYLKSSDSNPSLNGSGICNQGTKLENEAMMSGPAPKTEQNLGGFASSDSLPMLQWPDSDVEMETDDTPPNRKATIEEPGNDLETETPLATIVAQRKAARSCLRRVPRKMTPAGDRHSADESDFDSDKDSPLTVATGSVQCTPHPRPSPFPNLSAITAAMRRTPQLVSAIEQCPTPSPSPSLATPSPTAPHGTGWLVGPRTPHIWATPTIVSADMGVEESTKGYEAVPQVADEDGLSDDVVFSHKNVLL